MKNTNDKVEKDRATRCGVMSVTINDVLKLPCMKGAKVAGGTGGLTRAVSSITVLEFADANDLQQEILSNINFYGNELVITAFANIPNNLEQQCANIRRLAAVGEVGMILYYVGIFMPKVDPVLIELANQLDFVLIVMPENRRDLRYSEAISEVMEAIIKNQAVEISLLPDILDQMCRLPEHQRTIDTVLRMACDRSHTSLILADHLGRVLGQSNWPMSLDLQIGEFNDIESMIPVSMKDNCTVWRCPLQPGNQESMELYLIKDGELLNKEFVMQIVELVRLAVNLWSSNHAGIQTSELIRAILRDEPLKMRRLAELFHIDIASIHSMWVLRIENDESVQRQKNATEALKQLRSSLAYRCDAVLADVYEGYVFGFMAWNNKEENMASLSSNLIEGLAEAGIFATLVRCHGLIDTADVRQAFMLIKEQLDGAKCIWPTRQIYSMEELEFASQCSDVINRGEATLEKTMKQLYLLKEFREGEELLHTLCAYFLDAESSVTHCAEHLFLHKNTIKYRLGRIAACLGYHADKEPEKFSLYRAVAIYRLLEQHTQ